MTEREADGDAAAPEPEAPREEAALAPGAAADAALPDAAAEAPRVAEGVAGTDEPAPARADAAPAVTPPAAAPPAPRLGPLAERPETIVERPRRTLVAQSRRDFLLFGLATAATAVGAWWLLPERTKARLAPGAAHDRLDTLASRVGLSRERRERVLNGALTFDDDV